MQRLLSATAAAVFIATALPYGQQVAPPSAIAPAADEMPDTWFVQLASAPTIDGTAEHALVREEGRFHANAAQAGVRYRESRHFRHLWNGVTLETDAAGADTLRTLPGVAAVYPVVSAVRSQHETGGVSEADMMSALGMTGADVAQNVLGLSGRHIRVAVMDSGIDYDHPDLGGCFGAGCRVAKGWDFVGDAFNPDPASPRYNPVPVPDPLPDDCDGHGTHVAGIIGANGVIKGVAPQVTLHAYRVFGCDGPTTTDLILAAMEQAYTDEADILNISIGAGYQWPDYPTAQAADRLVKRGIVVVSTAGNDGANGLYAAAAPGIGRRTIGVASFNNTVANVSSFRVSPDDLAIGYLAANGSISIPTTGGADLVRTGPPTSMADACTALPASLVGGRVALIRRGGCAFVTKAANAQAAGAVAVVMYNTAPDRITVGLTPGPAIAIPVVSISGADGLLLSDRVASGPVLLTWTTDAVPEPLPSASLISSFSSWGPGADLSLKPDLGAPGGAIRSTLPLELGGFGTISGTSMAAPYVAGAIALLLEARPGSTAEDALRRLQNTAIPQALSSQPSLGRPDVVHRQGAGLISVDTAILTEQVVMPSRLALGEVENGKPVTRQLRIVGDWRRRTKQAWGGQHESGRHHSAATDPALTYTLGHEPAPSTGASTFVPTTVLSFATVTFNASKVKAGDDVWLQITPPANPDARVFSGYITITPDDDGPVLRVPYLGYSGDYQAIVALTPTTAGFPWLARLNGTSLERQTGHTTYTLAGTDVPFVLFHLEHQVRGLQVEIIHAGKDLSLGTATTQEFVGRNSLATSFFSFTWNGMYTPGAGGQTLPAPNGEYRLVLSVLKAGGNVKNPDHIERWTTPTFTIARPAPHPPVP